MKAFHNDPAIKQKYLDRLAFHRKADHLVQGVMWETNGVTKGCAIGCTFEKYSHQAMVDEWDVPLVLAKLEDRIFEGLSPELAQAWPERFTSALKVGVDYSMVWPKLALWLLVDPKDGAIKFTKTERAKESINGVAAIYERWISGEDITSNKFKKDAREARSNAAAYVAAAYAAADAAYAAADAAYAAADAAYATDAAAYAAYAAVDATDAAADAAYAAADAAYAAVDARKLHWAIIADKLIEIIEGEK